MDKLFCLNPSFSLDIKLEITVQSFYNIFMPVKLLAKQKAKQLSGTALIRLDIFNDASGWRLKQSLPTLKLLLKYADKIVILAHRGRPSTPAVGPTLTKFTLENEIANFSKVLGHEVTFLTHLRISEAANLIRSAASGSIFLLENIRLFSGETNNDLDLAEHLATLGNYYVNEAFSVSHRTHASIVGLPKFLPSYLGLHFAKEIEHLEKLLKHPRHPLTLILGGAKISSKTGLLLNFRQRADHILVGGGVANTLLYLKGEKIGASLVEKEINSLVLKVADLKQLVLPRDYKKSGSKIFDIGPLTTKDFISVINQSKTVIWNGPLGVAEKSAFAEGTKAIARALARSSATTIVGGGETADIITKLKLAEKMTWLSTGGGAMIEFLSGRTLPGLKALQK